MVVDCPSVAVCPRLFIDLHLNRVPCGACRGLKNEQQDHASPQNAPGRFWTQPKNGSPCAHALNRKSSETERIDGAIDNKQYFSTLLEQVKRHPNPTSPFSNRVWRAPARQTRLEKGEGVILGLLPRAALVPRLPWAIVVASLQDFSRTRFGCVLDKQVIMQICLSPHVGVISKRRHGSSFTTTNHTALEPECKAYWSLLEMGAYWLIGERIPALPPVEDGLTPERRLGAGLARPISIGAR